MRPVIIKLGGSVITDKRKPFTARKNVIRSLVKEIRPSHNVILTHGSGSFGHTIAKKYMTHLGLTGTESMLGMSLVQQAASRLHGIVMAEALRQRMSCVSFQPSSSCVSENGKIKSWDMRPIKGFLNDGFMPVTYGDVCFDTKKGCTILSTEEIISYMCNYVGPLRVVLCTDMDGVLVDGKVLEKIDWMGFRRIKSALGKAKGADVTGGMAQKVEKALQIARYAEVFIINGLKKGNLRKALKGGHVGTRVVN